MESRFQNEMFSNEKLPKVIKTKEEFIFAFGDSKNQFEGMRMFSRKKIPYTLEELQKMNGEIEYLPLVAYIKEHWNSTLSPEIAENEIYKQLILAHDALIERIQNFKSIEELKKILEETKELLKL